VSSLDPAPGPDAPLPESFGPYRVLSVLGRGGMGVVYRAQHRETQQIFALKTVSVPKRLRLAGIRAEILALNRLDHPQIVHIRDHGVSSGGVPWYVMDLLEGRTMASWLLELWPERAAAPVTTSTASSTMGGLEGGLPIYDPGPSGGLPHRTHRPPAGAGRLKEVLRLFRMLCEPLGYLHGRGIVHRDLKPSNVSIGAGGRPVLMDFGLISRARGSVGREALEAGGQLLGTVAYLSPEQVRRESLDARTDLYAFGCMLYEALTGVAPFRGPTTEQLLSQHLFEPPPRLSAWVEGVDPRLEELMISLLAKERRSRTGHADDVAHVLAAIEGESAAPVAEGPAYLYRPEIVGRDDVLAELSGLLTGLKARRGGYVFLSGESGIGKTFLAGEVARRAGLLGLRVVIGECAPAMAQASSIGVAESRGLPLQPLRPLLAAVADYCGEGGAAVTKRLFGSKGPAITAFFPSLASLPGQERQAQPPDLPAEESHRRLVESVLEVLAAYAAEGPPLLFLIDDLQWADELSLKIMAAIDPAWLEARGVMILATYRSDEAGKGLRALVDKPGGRSMSLVRMDASAVGRIAADMLAVRSVPETLVRFLTRQTEGVPFFVAEYLRAALSEGLLIRQAGRWRLKDGGLSEAELEALPLPSSIQGLMARRLGAVGPDLRRLVNLASVIGREADLDLLALAAVGSDGVPALEQIADQTRELVRLQILDSVEGGHCRFVHDKLREAAYAAIPPESRLELHREVARLLEERLRDRDDAPPLGELAHHFTQGQLWDKAIDYLEKAGEQAFTSFAHNEAVRYFTAALAHAPKASLGITRIRRARWERHLVDSYLGFGDMPSAHAHAQLALGHCGFRLPSSRLGWFAGFLGQVLLRPLQRLLPALFRVRSPQRRALINEAAYVLNRLCEPFFLSHKPLEGFYCGFRDLNLAERVPPSEAMARGYATMAMVVGVGPLAGIGRVWSDRAIGIARALNGAGAVTYCLSRSGSALGSQASWRVANERVAEAEALARSRSDLRQLGETVTMRALLTGFRGDFDRSLAGAEEVLALGASRGDVQLVNWGRNLSVHALTRLGRAREANTIVQQMKEDHASRVVGEAEKIFDLSGFSLQRLALGELAEARQQAAAVLAAVRKERFLPYFLKTALDAACEVLLTLLERADSASGEAARLRAETSEMVMRLQKFSALYAMARPRALIYRGQLSWIRGDKDQAFSSWERALVLARSSDMPSDLGRAHVEIARHLEAGPQVAGADRDGHRSNAIELLQKAGASFELQRAEELVSGAAGRPAGRSDA
jgi:serine/threonine protein kinase